MKKNQLHCCEECQIYWTCDTKWYRGERNEEYLCCPRCDFYSRCVKEENKNAGDKEVS